MAWPTRSCPKKMTTGASINTRLAYQQANAREFWKRCCPCSRVPHCTVAVIDLLADGDARTRWAELAAAAQGAPPLPVPQGTDLAERLAELTVPYDAIAEIVAIATRLGEDHLEFIRVCAAAVLRAMGGREVVRFPAPAPPSDLGRFGFVLMYAGLVPVIRDFHAQIGAPDSVSRATLADLGRNMHVYRRRYGTSGFDKQEWLALNFTGRLYQLGRLQFERTAVDRRTASAVSAAGVQTAPGDPVLSVHIPRYLGPLRPAECDESVARAERFFATRFPAEQNQLAICISWLLDPQLAALLGEQSNIATFQRRFALALPPEVDDVSPVVFTFDQPDRPRALLPRRSRLQQAVLDVLDRGGHWYTGTGWFGWPQ